MGRKDGSTLKEKLVRAEKGSQRAARASSWVAIGADTSLTACSVVAVGYDAALDKMVTPAWAEIRWLPDDDYFKRLGQAAKGHDLILDVLAGFPLIEQTKVYIAIEEPFYYGATKKGQSAWLKQQAEIAGSFKGSLVRYGFLNIFEINNSQWHAALRRDGVEFLKVPRGLPDLERKKITLANKFKVKEWGIKAYGLPELPDLVQSKSGAKIVRPESGFGAKAKAVQPSDVYDAAACAAWMSDEIENERV